LTTKITKRCSNFPHPLIFCSRRIVCAQNGTNNQNSEIQVVQVCSNNLQEDDHNAISGSISGLAERVAQQEALDAIAEANVL
jgi:hypothetical protein